MPHKIETLIMFKPDARRISFDGLRQKRLLHEVASGLLVASGLTIERHHQRNLNKNEVRKIYAKTLAPNPEDEAIWGSAWKEEVVSHIASGPIDSYLLSADNYETCERARDIKNLLRAHYGRKDNVVENIAHVPDLDEFDMTKGILFQDE